MNRASKSGFTLIELMLAMAFVSTLLLAVAMTVIQISNTYNRGITLKSVNQAGLAITSDLQRNIAGSASFSLSNKLVNRAWGGRLCTGPYSYIWNYAPALQNNDTNLFKYQGVGNPPIYFIKVYDPSASYCIAPSSLINRADATELLNDVNTVNQRSLRLAVYSVAARELVADSLTGQKLYAIDFQLGTSDTNAITGGSCITSGNNEDFTYCAINQFNIVVRTGKVGDRR